MQSVTTYLEDTIAILLLFVCKYFIMLIDGTDGRSYWIQAGKDVMSRVTSHEGRGSHVPVPTSQKRFGSRVPGLGSRTHVLPTSSVWVGSSLGRLSSLPSLLFSALLFLSCCKQQRGATRLATAHTHRISVARIPPTGIGIPSEQQTDGLKGRGGGTCSTPF